MDSGTPFSSEKYAHTIVKVQQEFDHRFADFKTHRPTFQNFADSSFERSEGLSAEDVPTVQSVKAQ